MSIKIQGTVVIDDSKNIINVNDITSTANVTATTFVGDGSQLTGVTDLGKSFFISQMTSGGDI